jgi:glutamate synthase (NADPH/NADH) small chain
MADPRGFLRVSRDKAKERAPQERVLGYQEFVVEPPPAALAAQASRCMDCGIPFCHQGCP